MLGGQDKKKRTRMIGLTDWTATGPRRCRGVATGPVDWTAIGRGVLRGTSESSLRVVNVKGAAAIHLPIHAA